jgi:hypothetical protein
MTKEALDEFLAMDADDPRLMRTIAEMVGWTVLEHLGTYYPVAPGVNHDALENKISQGWHVRGYWHNAGKAWNDPDIPHWPISVDDALTLWDGIEGRFRLDGGIRGLFNDTSDDFLFQWHFMTTILAQSTAAKPALAICRAWLCYKFDLVGRED